MRELLWEGGPQPRSRWWFQIFLFSPLFGEDFHFDLYFSDGLNPPTRDDAKAESYQESEHCFNSARDWMTGCVQETCTV